MVALIFNSGSGKRMGDLTKNNHKSMVKLYNEETIFERQIRILSNCGINTFIVTTGPFENQLKSVALKFPKLHFEFVHNDLYDKTNYIYSMYLAKQYIQDDVLMLHGDLVFNEQLVADLLKDDRVNIATVNINAKLPEKDFKCRIVNHLITEVSINIFDDNCYTFQPLYKLEKSKISLWLNKVEELINSNETQVYAENAFNLIQNQINLEIFNSSDYFIEEIDNLNDYENVNRGLKSHQFK